MVIRPPVKLALAVVTTGGLLYIIGQYVASQPLRIQQESEAKREITVQGTGEVHVKPEVARLTVGVQVQAQPTAQDALNALSERFTAVVKALKDLGIKDEDVKTTNLSLNPQYEYVDGRQTPRGFTASELVDVTIRDLTKIGQVLGRTTAAGANQSGGIRFEVEQPSLLQTQAEEAAIVDARAKAERLAKALGVRLGRVKTFTSSPAPQPPIFAEGFALRSADASLAAPPVPVGTLDATTTVTVTYELR